MSEPEGSTADRGVGSRAGLCWELLRPFTLAPPALGMLSGAASAYGAHPPVEADLRLLGLALAGAFAGSLLNGASNALNQIYDIEIDRVNKPMRPLPTGRLTMADAWGTVVAGYAMSLLVAASIHREFFLLTLLAAAMTVAYSAPPLRTKRHTFLANLTIAVPRGLLLKVAGWSTVRSAATLEPWYIGSIFGAFLLGAASTKDFADVRGDALFGCATLPVRYGASRAAWIIAPSFVLPFLLIPIGVRAGILTGRPELLEPLGFGLALWGCHVVRTMVRNPGELAATENHVSWWHMYWMMMTCQAGFALAYIL